MKQFKSQFTCFINKSQPAQKEEKNCKEDQHLQALLVAVGEAEQVQEERFKLLIFYYSSKESLGRIPQWCDWRNDLHKKVAVSYVDKLASTKSR